MTKDQRTGYVKSDETLTSILAELETSSPLRLETIAGRLELANSTVYDHLATLEAHDFIHRTDEGYQLGLRFLEYGNTARNHRDLFWLAREPVDQLAAETDELVWCIVEEQGRAIYLYGAQGERSIRTQTEIGQHTDLHHLAAGKAILAHLPQDRVDEIISTHGLTEFTPYTTTDPKELRRELGNIRSQGVAFNLQESVQGLHAIGAPIKKPSGGVHGAISISGPANRLTESRLKGKCSERLSGVANEIELNELSAEYDALSR